MAAVNKPEHYVDDSSENTSSNPTDNRSFREIAEAHLSRRNLLQGSLAVAAAGFLAPAPGHARGGWDKKNKSNKSLLDFRALATEDALAAGGKTVTVSPDYEYDVLIPWGSPINPALGVRPYEGEPDRRPTAAEQEQLIGIGHDGMWLFPANLPRVLRIEAHRGRELPAKARRRVLSNRAGMLCINHEFGDNTHVTGKPFPESDEDVRLSQAAHGVSVVAIARNWRGKWEVVPSHNSRRITVNTDVEFSGPVADSPLLANAAGNPARGTVNNCGSGPTPWGTYVTCEENFNGYFGTTRQDGTFGGFDQIQDTAYGRYGFLPTGFGYGWHVFDPRFDLSNPDYANESNRFGWCVEIDPFNADRKPVKRTALGRFKHEAAALKELDDGRVAVYMGDDQTGDYCYKYESNRAWRWYIARGLSPLDDGRLYVARFIDDANDSDGKGRGEWIELTSDNPDIAAAGLVSQDLVLTYTRLAADAVGATPMDRPEWSTIGTRGEVYWTMTNNQDKDEGDGVVNEVNPIFNNADGHIISTTDTSATTFEWSLFILARNTRPTDPGTGSAQDLGYAAYTAPDDGGDNTFTDPDAAYADPFGRLYIGTDGGQPVGLNDQLLAFDTRTGEYKRILVGVNNDEITGVAATPDHRFLFTNVQHAGDGDPTATNFPAATDGVTIPRDATIVLTRKDRAFFDRDDDDDDDRDDWDADHERGHGRRDD